MKNLLARCGFCSGSGAIQWDEEAPYPDTTFGGTLAHDEVSGAQPYQETHAAECPVCRGALKVKATLDTKGAFVECPRCVGSGREARTRSRRPLPCQACRGTGWVGGEPVSSPQP